MAWNLRKAMTSEVSTAPANLGWGPAE